MSVSLPQKYDPDPVPTDPALLADFLRQELDRIAVSMKARDEVVCGKATLDGGSPPTVTVAFARAQPDTVYQILTTSPNAEYTYTGNRTVNGFDIFGSVNGRTSNVHWAIFRDRDND